MSGMVYSFYENGSGKRLDLRKACGKLLVVLLLADRVLSCETANFKVSGRRGRLTFFVFHL